MAETPPVLPTTLIIVGGYMTWFAVHYWKDTAQKYPSGPVKALLTGKGLPAPVRGTSDTANLTALGQQFANQAGQGIGNLAGSTSTSNTVGTGAPQENEGAHGGAGPYSPAQLQTLWTSNGGDPAKAQYAAGVAMAESSGNPQSSSSNPDGGTNWGIWQLDTKGVGAGYPVSDLTDPDKSTQITVMATRNGTDWADWADSYTAVHGTHGVV